MFYQLSRQAPDLKIAEAVFFKASNISIAFWGEFFNLGDLERKYGQRMVPPQSPEQLLASAYQAKGPDFIHELNGHFSIVVLDHSKQLLTCYNDRYNTIPLYFYFNPSDGTFIVSNRIKAIGSGLTDRLSIDWDTVFSAFYKDLLSKSITTFVKGISLLDGGCYLELKLATFSLEVKSYWSLQAQYQTSEQAQANGRSAGDLIEEFRSLLSQSILDRCMNSETLGTQLSGGFDSSIVTAVAAGQFKLPAISILTANSLMNDELGRARQIAEKNKLDHYLLSFPLKAPISPGDWRNTVLTVQHLDCNLESYVKNQLLQQFKQIAPHIKYMLSGYGSDQLIGGLTPYKFTEADALHTNWDDFYRAMKKDHATSYLQPGTNNFYHFGHHFFNPAYVAGVRSFSEEDNWLTYLVHNRFFQIAKVGLTESHTSIQNDLHLRYPFLDNRILDFVLNVPKEFYGELLFDKNILRKAFQETLPSDFYEAPKFTPSPNLKYSQFNVMKSIVYGNQYELLDQVFAESRSVQEVFDRDTIFQFVEHNKAKAFYPALYQIIKLINIGLLDIDISRTEPVGSQDWDIQAQLQKITDWEKEKPKVEANMDVSRYRFDSNLPAVMNKPIQLLKDPEQALYYLLSDGSLEFEIDQEDVYRLFQAVDGKKSIHEIIKEKQLTINGLDEMLEMLFSEGYLSNYTYSEF